VQLVQWVLIQHHLKLEIWMGLNQAKESQVEIILMQIIAVYSITLCFREVEVSKVSKFKL